MKSLTTETALDILIAWLQDNILLLLLAYRALFCGDIGLNRFELVTLIRVGGKGAQQYASAKNAGVDDGPDCKPARFHGPCHGINRLSPHGEGLFHDEQRLTSHPTSGPVTCLARPNSATSGPSSKSTVTSNRQS